MSSAGGVGLVYVDKVRVVNLRLRGCERVSLSECMMPIDKGKLGSSISDSPS